MAVRLDIRVCLYLCGGEEEVLVRAVYKQIIKNAMKRNKVFENLRK